MDIHNLLLLVLITFLPGIELRLSIPVGLWDKPFDLPFFGAVNGLGLPLWEVLLVVLVSNIILGPIIYFALSHFLEFFRRFSLINNIYKKIVVRTQKRAQPYVGKWGLLGVALFIAIPLPGSGSWSGALIAYLLGLGYRRFFLANLLGVLIAGTLVTAATLGLIGFGLL